MLFLKVLVLVLTLLWQGFAVDNPTVAPTESPTFSLAPSIAPTIGPTVKPTRSPTTIVPTVSPSDAPTVAPSLSPSKSPTVIPTASPSVQPSISPTVTPSQSPTISPTVRPTRKPSVAPTDFPSEAPSVCPSEVPTVIPSFCPSVHPSMAPSCSPTAIPSVVPSNPPTISPSISPTVAPSIAPTTIAPSEVPTVVPSVPPSVQPSQVPTVTPSVAPTIAPTTISPSVAPSVTPSVQPSIAPSANPTVVPTVSPSVAPSLQPTVVPTELPSVLPTTSPTLVPSVAPSVIPSVIPSLTPTVVPTLIPTVVPTVVPTQPPTVTPSVLPTTPPTLLPTITPTAQPTSAAPSRAPTEAPSESPSSLTPSLGPTIKPFSAPTLRPSRSPTSAFPSTAPTTAPTDKPTLLPSEAPTPDPSLPPTRHPIRFPTSTPSAIPTGRPTSHVQTPFTFSATTLIDGSSSPTMDNTAIEAFKVSIAAALSGVSSNDVNILTITTSIASSTSTRRLAVEDTLRYLRTGMRTLALYDFSIDWNVVIILEQNGYTSYSDAYNTMSRQLNTATSNGDLATNLATNDPTTFTGVTVTNNIVDTVPTAAPTHGPSTSYLKYEIAVIVLAILICLCGCVFACCHHKYNDMLENQNLPPLFGIRSKQETADERLQRKYPHLKTRAPISAESMIKLQKERQEQRKKRIQEQKEAKAKMVDRQLSKDKQLSKEGGGGVEMQRSPSKRDADRPASPSRSARLETVSVPMVRPTLSREASRSGRHPAASSSSRGESEEKSDFVDLASLETLNQSELQYKINFLLQVNKAQRIACGLAARVFTDEMIYYMNAEVPLSQRELNRLWNYVSILEEENNTLEDILDKMTGGGGGDPSQYRPPSPNTFAAYAGAAAPALQRPLFHRRFSDDAVPTVEDLNPRGTRSPQGRLQDLPSPLTPSLSQRAVRGDYQYGDIYGGGGGTSTAASAEGVVNTASPLRRANTVGSPSGETPFQSIFNAPRLSSSLPVSAGNGGGSGGGGSSSGAAAGAGASSSSGSAPVASLSRQYSEATSPANSNRLLSRRQRLAEKKNLI